ncbi:hypothetical protein DFJ74DRAFT_654420 [Hyaloraphidium curvatum]|nr:hypothetical protein DFJ74DRAFT_654420 [Hyaloraphidium curvatum]
MASPIQPAITAFLTALGGRDLDAVVACYSPTCDFLVPGNAAVAPWLGKRTTRDEIREFYTLLWANAEPVSFELQHMVFDGNHCIITGELASRMTKTGKVFESMFTAHITVEDGLMSRYRVQEDSWGLVEAMTP